MLLMDVKSSHHGLKELNMLQNLEDNLQFRKSFRFLFVYLQQNVEVWNQNI